jgi:hypothetical protein
LRSSAREGGVDSFGIAALIGGLGLEIKENQSPVLPMRPATPTCLDGMDAEA